MGNSCFPIGPGCGEDEEEGKKMRWDREGRRRESHREMVPRHGKYLVSTGDFRVCAHVVMFRNEYVCFRMRTECVCKSALVHTLGNGGGERLP